MTGSDKRRSRKEQSNLKAIAKYIGGNNSRHPEKHRQIMRLYIACFIILFINENVSCSGSGTATDFRISV